MLVSAYAVADQAEPAPLKGTKLCPARIVSHLDADALTWFGPEAGQRLETWARQQLSVQHLLASDAECRVATRKLTPLIDVNVSPLAEDGVTRGIAVTLNLLDMSNVQWQTPVVVWQRLSFGGTSETESFTLEAGVFPLVQRHLSTLIQQYRSVNPAR